MYALTDSVRGRETVTGMPSYVLTADSVRQFASSHHQYSPTHVAIIVYGYFYDTTNGISIDFSMIL